MPVRTQYDPEADALEIRLSDNPVARTVELDDAHFVDLDAAGDVVAIELLAPLDPKLELVVDAFHLELDVASLEESIALAISSASSGSLYVVSAARYMALISPLLLPRPSVVSGESGAVAHREDVELLPS